MVLRWLFGMLIGTAVIGVTSPLFVRSYVPSQQNRGTETLRSNVNYRWRSEGYATTRVGPMGMPGKTVIHSVRANAPGVSRDETEYSVRLALWGDSQAEGVCVEDPSKIFAQTEALLGRGCDVFPLARSGDDLNDWLVQIKFAEQSLQVDFHVFLITQLSDLAVSVRKNAPEDPRKGSLNEYLASTLPAFAIESARNLLTNQRDGTRRKLRFQLGPVSKRSQDFVGESSGGAAANTRFSRAVELLDSSATKPVVLVYAPMVPHISGGKAKWGDSSQAGFEVLHGLADEAGFYVLDLREDFRDAARSGSWCHGFHNGQIGSGHLNHHGNSLIAKRVTELVAKVVGEMRGTK